MPETTAGFAYAVGFMSTMATLHGLGIGIGFLAGKLDEQYRSGFVRAGGSIVAMTGVGILAGVL